MLPIIQICFQLYKYASNCTGMFQLHRYDSIVPISMLFHHTNYKSKFIIPIHNIIAILRNCNFIKIFYPREDYKYKKKL